MRQFRNQPFVVTVSQERSTRANSGSRTIESGRVACGRRTGPHPHASATSPVISPRWVSVNRGEPVCRSTARTQPPRSWMTSGGVHLSPRLAEGFQVYRRARRVEATQSSSLHAPGPSPFRERWSMAWRVGVGNGVMTPVYPAPLPRQTSMSTVVDNRRHRRGPLVRFGSFTIGAR